MTRRGDYLAANRGQRQTTPGFILLVRDRRDGNPDPRLGITVSKKVGGAVVRNRMKRRFRVLGRELLEAHALAGSDHVLIGRREGAGRDFAALREDLQAALARAARKAAQGQGERRDRDASARRPAKLAESSNSATPARVAEAEPNPAVP
ncbi:MAG: ribonuclease P protein component [Sphingobium sp.]